MYNPKGHNKLYKLKVLYSGKNTYTFKPVADKSGNQLDQGSLVIIGDDESVKKFLQKCQIKDTESAPASVRGMKYMDMVLGIKAGKIKSVWIWKKNWRPSNKKMDLMVK